MNKNGIVQSVHFSKQYWTKASSERKLKDMGHTAIKPVHITAHMLEYRISKPETFHHFATLKRRNGIQIIIGFKQAKK